MSDAMIICKATVKMLSHLIPGVVIVGIGILIATVKISSINYNTERKGCK